MLSGKLVFYLRLTRKYRKYHHLFKDMPRRNPVAKQLAQRNLYQRIIPDKRQARHDWYAEWEPGDWLGGIHPAFDTIAGAEADAIHEVTHE